MNKSELIGHIASDAAITKSEAGRALDAMIARLRASLKKGKPVALAGLGKFMVRKRAARTGRNPRTGAVIKIKAKKVPAFKPGKALKDSLN